MQFNTPIIFFIYKRPNTTQLVFNKIREIKPTILYIFADGAKDKSEVTLVNQSREIIKQIDWDCELHINFSKKNLGCSDRIVSGLNIAFKRVETAIILEDDCLPDLSFFYYCEELLHYYTNNEEIMHISGFNILGEVKINESYFFSKYTLPPWGWATWKRAWELQNNNFDTWQQIKTWAYKNISQENFTDWTDLFEGARTLRKTWDVSWNVDLWKNNALGIIPKKNLIQNIGFGDDATFTKNDSTKVAANKAIEMNFPLNHPKTKKCDFDTLIEKEIIEAVRINRN
ncbi:MAG: nucleotide-diphospho-sugar transferase [Vicingaceae bacterium]|nr:nucleotide-diphospho-sugar transferase [Vicingaceae bacterium]